MTKYVYKVLEDIDTSDLEDVINKHSKKGWELVTAERLGMSEKWTVFLKGKAQIKSENQ